MDELFEIASVKKNNFSILIHCGTGEECRPSRFEEFFKKYPDANVILAHSNPALETLAMLKKYKNVKCDIACTKSDNIQTVLNSDFKNKVLFGTDFPVTHYFDNHLFGKNISLKDEYIKNCKDFFSALGIVTAAKPLRSAAEQCSDSGTVESPTAACLP